MEQLKIVKGAQGEWEGGAVENRKGGTGGSKGEWEGGAVENHKGGTGEWETKLFTCTSVNLLFPCVLLTEHYEIIH